MPRLAAKEKLLYYRTPEIIVEAIARYLSLRAYVSTRLLDPCAGTGAALALLASELKHRHEEAFGTTASRQGSVRTYGIEPELRRSREAFRSLDHVLQSSFFSTTLSNGEGPDGGWQVLFVNPPYDVDTEITGSRRKTRLEVSFLQRATTKLMPEGVLVWIVPQFVLKPAARILAGSYEKLTCVRFPDDPWQPDPDQPQHVALYEQFQQVIVFAQKRRNPIPGDARTMAMISAWADAGASLPSLPLSGRLPEIPTYYVPNAPEKEIRYFQAGSFDPDQAAGLVVPAIPQQRASTGVWSRSEYLAARIPDLDSLEPGIGSPMAPLKNAHLSVLAVAGIANQAVLTGKDGRRVIVKGSMRKVPVYSKQEDEHEIVERTTDIFETALWCIDLDTGGMIRVETGKVSGAAFPVEFESMSLPVFLENFGASLALQVTEENPARYTGSASVPWAAQGWQLLQRQPLGKQRETILATVAGFLQKSGAQGNAISRTAPIAEMASGKSFISLCSAFLADRYACGGSTMQVPGMQVQHIFPLVILCPPIMARKWKREAEQTLPNVRAVIVKRLGKPPVTDPRKVMEVERDDEGASQPTEDLRDFHDFDPTFTGSSLSALGCADRVVTRIQQELAAWQHDYQQALATGQTPPLKPCHIVIMTTSTAKLGKEWMPIYRMKVARVFDPKTKKAKILRDGEGNPVTVPSCPSCFRMLKDEKRLAQLVKLRGEQNDQGGEATGERREAWEMEARQPSEGYFAERDLVGIKDRRMRRFCSNCGEALWQYVPTKPQTWYPYNVLQPREQTLRPLPLPDRQHQPPCLTNTFGRRYPLGDYLHQRYRGVFHLVIADEVHEGADGTALDFARQRLAAACGRMMGLTGTLSNGYSASLFRLLYVLNPGVREKFGYHEVSKWIDLYGRRQTVQKTYKSDEREEGYGSTSDRRIGKPIIKELAGFAPHGLAHVLSCSTFLELSDVVPNLPPYREEIREVDLGEVAYPYEVFERETTRVIAAMLAKGDKSALSSWWNGLMTYPNMPYLGWTFTVKRTGETVKAPALPEDMLYPKERALVEYVQQEYNAGRRVLIYTENTGINDIMPRLKQVVETKVQGRHNIPLQVAILRSTTVDPIDREAWLDSQVEAGCDVLICNPKLVKVGLDLISFPTIIYMSLPKSTSDLRQSSRRSLRPGQTQPVNVVFFVYPTMEWRLLRLMAKKMQASLMVEGKLPGEGLVSFGEQEDEDEQDLYVQLAREVLASLEEGREATPEEEAHELQQLFTNNARIEREKNQTVGETTPMEAVEFDPIRVEPLSVSEDFTPHKESAKSKGLALVQDLGEPANTESPECEEVNHPPVVAQPVVTVIKQSPRKKPGASSTKGKETVTIIHTSVTAGKDPWADLRKKYLVPKRKRKNATLSSEVPTLWTHLEIEQMDTLVKPEPTSITEEEGDMPVMQHYLW